MDLFMRERTLAESKELIPIKPSLFVLMIHWTVIDDTRNGHFLSPLSFFFHDLNQTI